MSARKTVLSAIQPSNNLTLGNYIGAIRNWLTLQEQYDSIFFAVDLHAITVRQDPKELRDTTYRTIALYLASGIDPNKALLFVQSHVPEHAELAWVLSCFGYMGELNRMTQYKDKSAKQGANIPVGLFTYPLLMAADILLYGTNLVPVGSDQKQHVELTRDLAERMNNAFKLPLFTIPEPFIPPVGARVMSLQDPQAKMSKSDPDPNAAVYLTDSDDTIRKKLKRAVTDSGSEIAHDDSKPGIKNLLEIQAACSNQDPKALAAAYASSGKQYGHLKLETAEAIVARIGPIRDEATRIMNDRAELDRILKQGADRARERAQSTLKRVYEAVGFAPRTL